MSINKENVKDIKLIDRIIDGSQNIAYDNIASGLTSATVKDAIDEIASNLNGTDTYVTAGTVSQDTLTLTLSDGGSVVIDISGLENTTIDTGTLTFDTNYNETGSEEAGTMYWNDSDKTVNLVQNGTTLQLGQETHFMIRNATGSTIDNGTFLGFTGVTVGSNRIEASPFDASTMEEHHLVGFATETISNGINGLATTFGYVRDLDTRGTAPSGMAVGDEDWSVGDILYPHPTVPGKLTTVEPTTGFKAKVAVITNRHQSRGEIFVRVTPHNERFDEYATTAYSWGDHGQEGYATETYVNTAISNLIDGSPDALDTLNELAAALNDDENFASTVTNELATKATVDDATALAIALG
jgi:hypothetical protein